jgi:hypothetical protein
MAAERFDPTHLVHFDVGRGSIELEGASPRVLIAHDALLDLLQAAGGEAQRDFGHRLGTEIGRRMLSRSGELGALSLQAIADELGGELAVLGFGALAIERWGDALVLRVEGSALAHGGEPVLGAVLEGALQRAFARDVRAVWLSIDDELVRYVLLNEGAAHKAEALLDEGVGWGDVLARLNVGASA